MWVLLLIASIKMMQNVVFRTLIIESVGETY